ncbi:MAG: hypothetical protein AB8H80_11095 [Planctomycetota bacterium]
MRPSIQLACILAAATLPAIASAQDLRRGLVQADAVFVGRQLGKKPHSDTVALHRVQVLHSVRGLDQERAVTVLDWPKLSLHVRPTPRQSRLFCLQDASAVATRLGLPQAQGPYFKMVGWSGSHPLVQKDIARDAAVRFATILAESERGISAAITVPKLIALATSNETSVRCEVTRFLAERKDLRSRIDSLQWSHLMTRAAGEADDIIYKIALAELCAEQRLEGLLDALMVSLGPVTDPRYARCVGRIGKLLHGEAATAKLAARLRMAASEPDRNMLLMAMGATNTKSALDALMSMDKRSAPVAAALREHRAPAAQDAVARKKR